jgi:hypothetical protein
MENVMLRILALLVLAFLAVTIFALDGRFGPIDLTKVPPPMMGFIAISLLVLVGLRRI